MLFFAHGEGAIATGSRMLKQEGVFSVQIVLLSFRPFRPSFYRNMLNQLVYDESKCLLFVFFSLWLYISCKYGCVMKSAPPSPIVEVFLDVCVCVCVCVCGLCAMLGWGVGGYLLLGKSSGTCCRCRELAIES